MSEVRCKGTVLKLSIASVLTTIAQMTELEPPSWESKDYNSETIDQSAAGIPRQLNGYVDGGKISATFWWDPVLATHQAVLALVTPTPAKGTWEQVLTNGTPNLVDFTTAGLKLSPKIDMGKSMAAQIEGNLDGVAVLS